ncbi:MAG: carboxylating nicotinate-nucleotide diphosphorylase [Candidatus Heimdallarchaeota archaeon]
MAYLPSKLLEQRLLRFLEEDLEIGDVTAELIPNKKVKANIIAKEEGIICGTRFAGIIMEAVGINVVEKWEDGRRIKAGDTVLNLEGMSKDILTVERTVLNLIMRLSGIATLTNKLVNVVNESGLGIRITATRKTTPGFRYFEKYAVKIGGGDTHRWGLSDAILIKKNHLSMFDRDPIRKILHEVKTRTSFSKKIEIEVENNMQLQKALEYGPDIIMLDNFNPEAITKAVGLVEGHSHRSRPLIEVSGGIKEANIGEFLIPGVDILSMGLLTHSAKALDFSLLITGP